MSRIRTRRAVLAAGLLAAWAAWLPAAAQPAAYPSKPVRWIVPFPPGGAMDVIARTLAERAAKASGQPFVVENRSGAGGNIGAEAVARAPADGHTMMIVSIGMATNPFLYPKLSYDPRADFAPVSLLAVVPNVLVVNAAQDSPKSVPDLIARAKAQPGKVSYASAGNGTSIHLAGELFASMAGLDMLHVPYRGSAPAVTDLLGGQVDAMFDSITSARPHIQSGKLRALAVTTAKRSAALPDVPTIAEAGLPGYELSPWFAVFMPRGVPAQQVARMNTLLVEALATPEARAKLDTIGAEPIGSSPQALAAHLEQEMSKWGRIVRERGIRAD